MSTGLYTFNINNFQITQTRSAHTDTVWVSVSVKLGTAPPLFAVSPKSLGNLNNGTYNTGVSCPNVALSGTPLVFNYLIINAGAASAADVYTAMKNAGADLANNAGLTPPFASCLSLAANDSNLQAIFKKGSCDGLVAAEQNTFTVEDLLSDTARSPYFTQATSHTGTKAGSGCNSNLSAYLVHWSLAQVADLPNVIGMPLGTVRERDTAAYTLFQAGFGYQTSGTGLYVKTQSPAPSDITGLTQSVTEPVVLTLTTTEP